jgi:thiol peroxidase
MQERKGAVTFQGEPLTLLGPELVVGDQAPPFELLNNQLQIVSSKEFAGKVLLISVAPSLDTPVCALQAKRFHQELGNLPPSATVIMVTADLPFAQGRFCNAEGVAITTLSDHLEMAFGDAYGTHILELRLECRALFVVGKEGLLKHVEYVKEVTEHPDYDRSLAVVRANA